MSRTADDAVLPTGSPAAAARLRGLDETTARQVIGTAQALAMGRAEQAEPQLRPALRSHPDHPEVLRLHAGILSLRGRHADAIAAMRRAVDARPMDALYHNTLGSVLGTSGDFDGAVRALNRACELQPSLATAWYNLGIMLIRCVRNAEAAAALQRAVELDPDNVDARAQLGDMLRTQGRTSESAAEYRKVLTAQPAAGMAWWGLADLRTGTLDAADIERMRAALRDGHPGDEDRIAIGFALAKALDEAGRYDESLEELKRANAIARLRQRWSATDFSASITAVNQAFEPPPAGANDRTLGDAVIFIVGMPRSGTTLVEQILAAHSEVEGTGELTDLPMVLAEQARIAGKPFPQWVAAMQSADWQRLGERYLERTEFWRKRRPRFTDKLPNNWMYMGAIRAMLPGARIVVCRRDPLETCFSCYRQHLAGNEWTRTPEDLAAFWRDFDRTATQFTARHPTHIYQHEYEALIADPERGVHSLLDACGLPFEEACLRFHASTREVHSPSATQVRQPLNSGTARAQDYGARLDPIRLSLGMPAYGV